MLGVLTLLGLNRRGRVLSFAGLACASCVACAILFPPAKAACGAVFLLGLLAGACVDIDRLILPDVFTMGLALAGLALSFAAPSLHGFVLSFPCLRSGAAAFLGLAIGSALALWIGLVGEWILGREVLGFGDVKLLGAIGAFCGWQGAVFSLFGGAILAVPVLLLGEWHRLACGGDTMRLLRMESPDGRGAALGWRAHFPFGPMLAAAAAIYFLALHGWADRELAPYLALFRVF